MPSMAPCSLSFTRVCFCQYQCSALPAGGTARCNIRHHPGYTISLPRSAPQSRQRIAQDWATSMAAGITAIWLTDTANGIKAYWVRALAGGARVWRGSECQNSVAWADLGPGSLYATPLIKP